MIRLDHKLKQFSGPGGSLPLSQDDDIALKLAMLIEGECGPDGPTKVAACYGFSRPRYYQIRKQFYERGVLGLVKKKPGPKKTYRRKEEVVCQAIRHRFLDPDASTEIITQKLKQNGFTISNRSVERIIEQFGLQKKTLRLWTRSDK